MSYPPQKTLWVAGERVDAADLNEYASLQVGWGLVDEEQITSPSSSFTSIADISGLSITFTAIASRKYVVSFDGLVVSTLAADRIDVYITDGSNTVIKQSRSTIDANSVSENVHIESPSQTPSAGSVTYKIRAERTSGSGTCTVSASATNPTYIRVMDVGPA